MKTPDNKRLDKKKKYLTDTKKFDYDDQVYEKLNSKKKKNKKKG